MPSTVVGSNSGEQPGPIFGSLMVPISFAVRGHGGSPARARPNLGEMESCRGAPDLASIDDTTPWSAGTKWMVTLAPSAICPKNSLSIASRWAIGAGMNGRHSSHESTVLEVAKVIHGGGRRSCSIRRVFLAAQAAASWSLGCKPQDSMPPTLVWVFSPFSWPRKRRNHGAWGANPRTS